MRSLCAAWVDVQTVSPRVMGSGAANTARPSIGTPASFWLMMRSLTTTCALAKRRLRRRRWCAPNACPDVPFGARPDQWSALFGRLFDRGDRRQRLVIDNDRVGGVARLILGFGDDRHERLAQIAHLIDRQYLGARGCRVGRRCAGQTLEILSNFLADDDARRHRASSAPWRRRCR